MKKEVIAFKNTSEISHQLARFEDTKHLIDRVLDQWTKLGLDPINLETLNKLLRGENLKQIVQQTIVDSLNPSDLKIAGRPASRESVANLLVPPDLTDLESAVEAASTHFPPLQICKIRNNKIEIDDSKFKSLEASNTVTTTDLETLEQVRNIISGVKYLIDRNLVHKAIVGDLIHANVLDPFVGDGLQPNRKLFIQKS